MTATLTNGFVTDETRRLVAIPQGALYAPRPMSTMLEALERAIELAGGQPQFADRLNTARQQLQAETPEDLARPIKQQHVDYWLRVMKRLPERLARAGELATDGNVTRYQFRPDVFGDGPEQMPMPSARIVGLATSPG